MKNLSNNVILCNQWTAISICWGKTVVVRFSGCFWEIVLISDWRSNVVVLGSFSSFHASFHWKAGIWSLSFECCLIFFQLAYAWQHFRKVKHRVKSHSVLSSSKNHYLIICIKKISLKSEMEVNLWKKWIQTGPAYNALLV